MHLFYINVENNVLRKSKGKKVEKVLKFIDKMQIKL